MKSFFLTSVLLTCALGYSYSQSKPPQYYIGVPETSNNTNAIVRYANTTYELNSTSSLVIQHEEAVTVLDNEGKSYGQVVIHYDQFSKIQDVDIWIYDALGQKIENVKMPEMEDVSYTGNNLYDDSRLKYYIPQIKKTPYTVHYQYKKLITDFFHLPMWRPQPGTDVLVEKAKLSIFNNSGIEYRFYPTAFPDSALSMDDQGEIRQWEVLNLPAFDLAKYGPPSFYQIGRIDFPMTQFQMDGYQGSFQSWKDVAQWRLDLKEGLQELAPKTKAFIHSLTDTIEDPKEKARQIYKWMQKETRYVSIQLGVGGWQPASALEVDEKKYGDCKALTNYTQALMSSVGIESLYSIIQAGTKDHPIDPAKVYNQFNHVILCIPFSGDTTWLECTSSNYPFGFIGDFTDNRYALVANENNSKLVKTKVYTSSDNLQTRKSILKLNEEGGLIGELKASYHDVKIDERFMQIDEQLSEQKDNLYRELHINGMNINHLKYKFIDSIHPCINENVNFDIRKYASTTATRMFIPLYYLNPKPKKIKAEKNRSFPVVLKRGETQLDSIFYEIPAGYQVANLPDSIYIESEFGSYHAFTQLENQLLFYYRKEIRNSGRFPAQKFEEFRSFKNAIRKADQVTLVLEKLN